MFSSSSSGLFLPFIKGFGYGVITVFLLVLVLVVSFHVVSYFISYREGRLTFEPEYPCWLRTYTPLIYMYDGEPYESSGVRVYGHPFKPLKNGTKDAIVKIRKLILSHTNQQVSIPDDTCIVQVPMPNFKCGRSHTSFEPITGDSPGSYLVYQMYGNEKIQVIRYVEDGRTYVAGYCVYIWWPYDQGVHYRVALIDSLYTTGRYFMKASAPEMEMEMEILRNARDVLVDIDSPPAYTSLFIGGIEESSL